MITICEIFANEYSVMFNAKKTAGIQFGQQKELCEIKLNGQVIKGTRHKQNSLSGNTLFNYMPTYTRSQKKS